MITSLENHALAINANMRVDGKTILILKKKS